ncbi:PFE-CTERM domain-containing protein [Thalassoporum mexicanum]|uniref:PFE-CTERM domain-containing protein n=1 Tax=Thalassoporum mexicanum TaxID=3457544 RepID=UPI0012EAC160|nr:hypothetical protein [Pseudanabaena sp. PCC 7367]
MAAPLPPGVTSVDPVTPTPVLPPFGATTFAFNESQQVTIAPPAMPIFAEVATALLPAGPSGPLNKDTFFPGPLPFGTYNSHFLHFDPGGPVGIISAGSVTFAEPIAGVIFFSTTLAGSDALAAPPVVAYPPLPFPRGTEEGPSPDPDSVAISADRLTLSFSLISETPGDFDQIRVITVPFEFEATAGLALLGLYGAWEFTKRKRKSALRPAK